MLKSLTTILLCFILTQSFGQRVRQTAIYLNGQFNTTLYDITKGNNPWGMGLGAQVFFKQSSKISPTIDITADAYLMDDKVLRLDDEDKPYSELGGMVNIFAGGAYHPASDVYLSLVAGPSFLGDGIKFGIKPSLGVYFPRNHRWMAKVSYINIFNRDVKTKQDFGSLSFGIGVRLY